MRILMMAQFYPPYIGREERYTQDLSRQLAARGHSVAVATLWNKDLPGYETDQGVRVHRIRGTMQRANWLFSKASHPHAPPFSDPELTLALGKVIARERPQIVHAHNWLIHSFLPLKALNGARLVLHLHEYSMLCATKKLIYQGEPCSGPGVLKCVRCASSHYGAKGPLVAATNAAMRQVEHLAMDMFRLMSS